MTINTKKKKHKHCWKYESEYNRVCEAPFPTIESCGKREKMTAFGGWVDANEMPEGGGL